MVSNQNLTSGRAVATRRQNPGRLTATLTRNNRNYRYRTENLPVASRINIRNTNNLRPNIATATSLPGPAIGIPVAQTIQRANISVNTAPRMATSYKVKPSLRRISRVRHLVGGRKNRTKKQRHSHRSRRA